MKSFIVTWILIVLSITPVLACSCECEADCSFNAISNNSEFVALVKVLSYEDYLEKEILGYDGQMPYSMMVEVIRVYKGSESRKTIKIWGDNGSLCRPYLSNFGIGEYYLIAPNKLGTYKLEGEGANDYDFFSCNIDYLKVNMKKQKAYGEYTNKTSEIELKAFEKNLVK